MGKSSLKDHFQQYELLIVKKGTFQGSGFDAINYVYYIEEGYIQIIQSFSNSKNRNLTYSQVILKPGEIFPLITIKPIDKQNCIFQTLSKVYSRKMPLNIFKELVSKDNEALAELYINVSNVFERVMEKASQNTFNDAFTKILTRLISIARSFGTIEDEGIKIPFILTHENLAKSIGIARETVSVYMKVLEKKNFVRYKGRFIYINLNKSISYLENQGIIISKK